MECYTRVKENKDERGIVMKKILGITMGDPAGIGAEIALKALSHKEVYECIPIIIGDCRPLEDALAFTKLPLRLNIVEDISLARGEYGAVDLLDLKILGSSAWEYKKAAPLTGKASYKYIEKAVELAKDHIIDAIVTGPINKESINLAGYHYSGHTEILGELTGTKNFAMLLASKDLRVIHVTTHVSMRDACDMINEDRVYRVIKLAREGMLQLGFPNPRIGVAGFNPHSSENGLFGDQEEKAIIPAVNRAKSEGFLVEGPVPPDTVFVKAIAGLYDIVVAMYHDQGHIPFKLNGFKLDRETDEYTVMSGINCTIGAPIIRTSVDHGTAYDRAGEGRANEGSMVEAIMTAITMVNNRTNLQGNL